jgi:hypothetical protein
MSDLNNTPPPEELLPEELQAAHLEPEPPEASSESVVTEPIPEKPKRLDVENLSVAEALGWLVTRPTRTLRAIGNAAEEMEEERAAARRIARAKRRRVKPGAEEDDIPLESLLWRRPARRSASTPRPTDTSTTSASSNLAGGIPVNAEAAAAALQRDYILIPRGEPLRLDFSPPIVRLRPLIITAIMLVLWFVGVAGGIMMLAKTRNRTQDDIMPGLLLLLLGGVGFGIIYFFNFTTLRLPSLNLFPAKPKTDEEGEDTWLERNGLRVVLFVGSSLLMVGAYLLNGRNQFTQLGVLAWIGSIIGFVLTFAPGGGRPVEMVERFGRFIQSIPSLVIAIRITPTFIALVIILFAGFYFRFNDLEAYPPDMTSDHVEKARDAWLIEQGYRPVFLPNNGGREVAHFYFLAALGTVTRLPMDFNLLKIGSGFWGMCGILAAFYFGRSFFREEDKQLATLTGLSMAALMAVSYWHIMLSRLGLRIVMTPLMTMLILLFFVRALRHNQRRDWIISGLLLGIGIYCYQAMRMAPVFIIVGFIFALLIRTRSGAAVRSYVFNFFVLVIISLAVFVPLGRFMIEYPSDFWSRTSGRFFGEDTIEVKDAQGNTVSRIANTQDRLEAFQKNLGFLGSNMVKSVLMYNWYGDAAWVTGTAPDAYPELDYFSGSLLLLGLGAWIVRMIKRRDPSDWLIVFGTLVMLLPTALSLAFTIEVPSSTRASGSIPFVYLMCAFAAAVILREAWRALHHPALRVVIPTGAAIVVLAMASQNSMTYFKIAMAEYRNSTLPHAQAGKILRGFADSTGAPGNAFMVAFPYWWDHRALAINAQDMTWDNGVLQDNLQTRLIEMIRRNTPNAQAKYRFRTDKQVLFFVNPADKASMDALTAFIPGIQFTRVASFNTAKDFMIGIAPPVGCEWWGKYMAGAPFADECLPPGRMP